MIPLRFFRDVPNLLIGISMFTECSVSHGLIYNKSFAKFLDNRQDLIVVSIMARLPRALG